MKVKKDKIIFSNWLGVTNLGTECRIKYSIWNQIKTIQLNIVLSRCHFLSLKTKHQRPKPDDYNSFFILYNITIFLKYVVGLPIFCWDEAVTTATYLLNKCVTKRLKEITLENKWSRVKPNLSIWRCLTDQFN